MINSLIVKLNNYFFILSSELQFSSCPPESNLCVWSLLADTWWHLAWIKSWRYMIFEPLSPWSPTSSLLELHACPWARGDCCLQPLGTLFRSLSSPYCVTNGLSLKNDPAHRKWGIWDTDGCFSMSSINSCLVETKEHWCWMLETNVLGTLLDGHTFYSNCLIMIEGFL